ncbi:hypothetical protein M231_02776 [Tremella mesenterica]|uniref:Uncharacterized protein n=2 Tax=Tremella mesenterica TaxID=5217 RepID=A0A4Q1BPX9_TREME|nr:hypothetical protein M231_02776 [Tremella mesenterica]
MANMGKRQARNITRHERVDEDDTEKGQEELDLEERLFGRRRKKARVGAGLSVEDDEGEGMKEMMDEELFMVDAPLADLPSDDESEAHDVSARFTKNINRNSQEEDGDDHENSVSGSSGDRNDFESNDDDQDESGFEESDLNDSDPASRSEENSDEDTSQSEDEHDHSNDELSSSRLAKHKQTPQEEEEEEDAYIIPAPNVTDFSELIEVEDGEKRKKKLWRDPADDAILVDLDSDKRLRKLGRGKGGGKVNGVELERRLRQQYEALHPRPSWASLRLVPHSQSQPSLSALLASTKSFIAPNILGQTKRQSLEAGTISIQRVKDANHQNPTAGKMQARDAAGGVVSVAWHPNPQVGVVGVAGGDRRVRFFQIDDQTNPPLLTLHTPSLPLQNITFHPSGSQCILTGPRPHYYTYDLSSQTVIRSPRALFGSKPGPSTPNSLAKHSFSPDGTLLAVAGRRGCVSILDWSAGAGAVVAELKSGRGGAVGDMVWNGEGELSILGGRDGSEVEVWDVGERRVIKKWSDDRMFGGGLMRLSKDKEWTSVGSSTGIVNVYSTSSLKNDKEPISIRPNPIKSLEHLTTSINCMEFHPSGEILVSASGSKPGALKLYHLPSFTAFSNWPRDTTPLGRITSVTFDPLGKHLAVGNQRGKVLLWSLKHYS